MKRLPPSTLTCKEGVDFNEFMLLSPYLIFLFGAFTLWCHQHDLPVRITSVVDDYQGRRASPSHAQGRAIDISVNGWPLHKIQQAIDHFNKEYEHIAALSFSDGKPRAIVYHRVDGGAWHLHLQVRPIKQGE